MVAPHDGSVNPSQILRAMAQGESKTDLKRHLEALAYALEWQHNAQNNHLAAVVGNAELGLENQIAALARDITERLDKLSAAIAQLSSGGGDG